MDESRGGFLISQIKQLQDRIFERLLKDHSIEEFNGAQGRILYVLWREDGLPISELGKRTSLAKTTLTSMLDRMEAKGHVARVFDSKDRRQTRIRLTESARKLDEKYQEISREMTRIFYKGFKNGGIRDLEAGLEKILHNLKEWEGQNGRNHAQGNHGTRGERQERHHLLGERRWLPKRQGDAEPATRGDQDVLVQHEHLVQENVAVQGQSEGVCLRRE